MKASVLGAIASRLMAVYLAVFGLGRLFVMLLLLFEPGSDQAAPQRFFEKLVVNGVIPMMIWSLAALLAAAWLWFNCYRFLPENGTGADIDANSAQIFQILLFGMGLYYSVRGLSPLVLKMILTSSETLRLAFHRTQPDPSDGYFSLTIGVILVLWATLPKGFFRPAGGDLTNPSE